MVDLLVTLGIVLCFRRFSEGRVSGVEFPLLESCFSDVVRDSGLLRKMLMLECTIGIYVHVTGSLNDRKQKIIMLRLERIVDELDAVS